MPASRRHFVIVMPSPYDYNDHDDHIAGRTSYGFAKLDRGGSQGKIQ